MTRHLIADRAVSGESVVDLEREFQALLARD
jgi:hypothetical protein